MATDSRVWFITGSSRGLGRAITRGVLEAGHRVAAAARRPSDLDEVARQYGDRVKVVPLDVTDPEQAARAVKAAVDAFGRIDVLVNNAGYADTASAEDMPLEDFRRQIDTNFYGVVYVTRAVLPVMRKQRSGRILQITSIGGRRGGTPGLSAYQAAKFAVAGFSEVVINEVAPLGIQLTIVEPGGFATDWAGTSMKILPSKPDYEGTVGATAKRLRGNPGAARGVPDKAARALLALASMPKQPRRLVLGTDAYVLAKAKALELIASDDANRQLSASTDADGLPDFGDTDVGRAMLSLEVNRGKVRAPDTASGLVESEATAASSAVAGSVATVDSSAVAGSAATVASVAVAGSAATVASAGVAGSAAAVASSAVAGSIGTVGSVAVAGSLATAFSLAVAGSIACAACAFCMRCVACLACVGCTNCVGCVGCFNCSGLRFAVGLRNVHR